MEQQFETSSKAEFVKFYSEQSDKKETWDHFERVYQGLMGLSPGGPEQKGLRIGDIGGGAGTLSRVLAANGQKPICIDVNEPLIEIGRTRAQEAGMDIEFRVGSATKVPVDDGSLDMFIASELLEHVEAWELCLDEAARTLRPGGLAYFSTTNVMCPKQSEFNLPFYSWYPAPLKRYFLRRVATDRPDLANYATYPAYNWFSFYSLKKALAARGFGAFYDVFDLAVARGADGRKGQIMKIVTSSAAIRFLAYFFKGGTTIIGVKR